MVFTLQNLFKGVDFVYLELKNNFHKIIDNYTIPGGSSVSKTNTIFEGDASDIDTITSAESVSKPFMFGTWGTIGCIILGSENDSKSSKNSIPEFEKTNPDIYGDICNYCESKNIDEASLYTKALVSKSTFSKIRSMKRSGYKPDKSTIIRLALVLRLTLPETQVLLNKLGYVLSDSLVIDKVVAWCIEHNCYDFDKMDDILIANDIPNTLMPQGLA